MPLCQVISPEAQFHRPAPDFPDPYWFPHWRTAKVIHRFASPIVLPPDVNLGMETLLADKVGLSDVVRARCALAEGFETDEAEDFCGEPAEVQKVTLTQRKRNQDVARQCKRDRHYTCELCSVPQFVTTGGVRYCETHHIISLGAEGWDHKVNIAVLCANCHRQMHYGLEAETLKERLLSLAERAPLRKLLAKQ